MQVVQAMTQQLQVMSVSNALRNDATATSNDTTTSLPLASDSLSQSEELYFW